MIPFTKAHGNGNDFVIFDAKQCPDSIRDPGFIQRVCDRHKGVGADAILILSPSTEPGVEFNLDYYNSDGSWETFCANGSRCALVFYSHRHELCSKIIIRTGAFINPSSTP